MIPVVDPMFGKRLTKLIIADMRLSPEVYNQLRVLQKKAKELRTDVRNLRRTSQANAITMKEILRETVTKITWVSLVAPPKSCISWSSNSFFATAQLTITIICNLCTSFFPPLYHIKGAHKSPEDSLPRCLLPTLWIDLILMKSP